MSSSTTAPVKTSTWIGFINPFIKFAQPTIATDYITVTDGYDSIDNIKSIAATASPDAMSLFLKYGRTLSLIQARIYCGACDFAAVLTVPPQEEGEEPTVSANRYTIAWSNSGVKGQEYAKYTVNTVGTGTANAFSCNISKNLLTYATHEDKDVEEAYRKEALATGDSIANMLAIMGCQPNLYIDVSATVVGISSLGALYTSFGVPYSANYMIAVPLTVQVGRIVVKDNDVEGWEAKMALGMSISKTTITVIQCSIPQQLGFQAKIREYADGDMKDRKKIDWFWDVPRLYSQHLTTMDNRPNYFITITTFADFVACVLYLNTYITRYSQLQAFIAQPKFDGNYENAIAFYNKQISEGEMRARDAKIITAHLKDQTPDEYDQMTLEDINDVLPDGSPFLINNFFAAQLNSGKPGSYARSFASNVLLAHPAYIFDIGWWEHYFERGFNYFNAVAAKVANPGDGMPTESNVTTHIANRNWQMLYKILRQIIVPTANAIEKADKQLTKDDEKEEPKRKKAGNAGVLLRGGDAFLPEEFFKNKNLYKKSVAAVEATNPTKKRRADWDQLPKQQAKKKYKKFPDSHWITKEQREKYPNATDDDEIMEFENDEQRLAGVEPKDLMFPDHWIQVAEQRVVDGGIDETKYYRRKAKAMGLDENALLPEPPAPSGKRKAEATGKSPATKKSSGATGTVKPKPGPPPAQARAKKSMFTTGDTYQHLSRTTPAHNVLAKGDKGMIVNVHEAGYYRPYLLQWNDNNDDYVVKDQITNKSIPQHVKQYGLSLTNHGQTLVD